MGAASSFSRQRLPDRPRSQCRSGGTRSWSCGPRAPWPYALRGLVERRCGSRFGADHAVSVLDSRQPRTRSSSSTPARARRREAADRRTGKGEPTPSRLGCALPERGQPDRRQRDEHHHAPAPTRMARSSLIATMKTTTPTRLHPARIHRCADDSWSRIGVRMRTTIAATVTQMAAPPIM